MNIQIRRRDCKTWISQSYQLIGALSFIGFQYYVLVFLYMKERYKRTPISTIGVLMGFHILFVMLLWSMTRSIISDPGKVPTYWGVIMDDPESKKRRYCLICHQFKPERSHHCSTCQRCVLNMDHHCPWIMNCIGYQNRKFFILMIFYITLTVFYIVIVELFEIIILLQNLKNVNIDVDIILKFFAFITSLFFLGVISNFFKFHIQLLLSNSTTIETMDKQRQEQQGQIVVNKQNPFDLGYKNNFYQVFGLNPLLWPFPMFGQSGNPYGDGVIWEKKQTEQNTQEENT